MVAGEESVDGWPRTVKKGVDGPSFLLGNAALRHLVTLPLNGYRRQHLSAQLERQGMC